MKNLVLLTETRHSVSSTREGDFILSLVPNPNADHDDPEFADASESFHYILSPSGTLSGISSTDSIIWSINLNEFIKDEDGDADADANNNNHAWFHLSHEENSDSLVALSRNGAIISVTPQGANAELIGCFDHGIECAAWSADSELLAIVTYQEDEADETGAQMVPVLMTMNTQFEILSEVNLPHHVAGEAISVCWNKKTDQLVAISTHDSEDNTRKIRIFKGESLENVATSRTEDGSGKLIPNILCIADIAWAGSNTSNLLACVQRKGRKGRNIVFLEQNGLQHGGFKLEHRLDHEEVVGLEWNSESDLLAINLTGKGQSGLEYGKVQFYHRNNYHWYLKYEIQLNDGVKASGAKFDEIKGYDVSISLQNTTDFSLQEWRHYRFIWDTSTASENGTAAVVDGNNVNLTMFNKAMIPPPMYASRLTFEKSIVGVSHIPTYLHGLEGSNGSGIDLIVHLTDGTLAFCDTTKATFDGGKSQEMSIIAQVDLSNALDVDGRSLDVMDSSCLRQCHVVDMRLDGDDLFVKMIAIACSKASSDCEGPKKMEELVSFTLKISWMEGSSAVTVIDRNRIVLEGKALRMVNWSNSEDASDESTAKARGGALIELIDGSLFQYSSSLESSLHGDGGDGEVLPCEAEPMLLEPCPWIAGLLHASGDRQLIIGLSSRFRLYFGERQLCDASSSFILSPTHEFLGYVTLGSRSQIRFLPLKVLLDFDPLMGSDDNLEVLSEGYEPRNVERGSTLVSILPHKPSAVLQLARGNLEGIYPRALVLPHIMSLIDEGDYHLAIDTMRRQKVDMNLIVDMDPTKCLEGGGLGKMVGQVTNMDHLNLFLASLQNYNVTEWKYKVPAWLCRKGHDECKTNSGDDTSGQPPFDFSTKVNQVCSKMRSEMIQREEKGLSTEGQFLLPILSTFAKENPPQLQNALELIKQNAISKASAVQSSKKRSILLSDHAQSSIKYLAFLADYALLFDTALGMYDFELAKAVARNSQMDPKVYLPMLKRLRSLPEFEAKYEVDVKLKRFESALTHLYKLGVPEFDSDSKVDFSEEQFSKCMKFIEEHQLHQLGLELFVGYPSWHNQIMLSLGERLLKDSNAELSLSIFLAAKPPFLEGAKKAARMCGDYSTFFSCFDSEELSEDEKREIATDVADEVASGRGGFLSRRDGYAAGARILLDYCQDIEGAVDMLITAEMWFEARRLALLHGESEIQRQIIDAAVSYGQSCLSDFESRGENFLDANKRYAEVVVIRRKAKLGDDTAAGDAHDETGSLFSLASNASNSSVRSNMSSSSVGSVTSVSSVISAGAASTFSLINNEESIRHKSKFNNIGRKKKKTKTSRRERLGTKPGSEEELKALVTKMESNIIDSEYSAIISETIRFLSQVGKLSIAGQVYEAYESLKHCIDNYQKERIDKDGHAVREEEHKARREGQFYERVVLECEEGVNGLRCSELPQVIHRVFTYKIDT